MAGTQRTRARFKGSAGAVNLSEAEITFSAAAARVLVESLPAGAVILTAWVEVLEAFNAGVSNLVTMGSGAIGGGTAAAYVSTVDETQASLNPGDVLDSAPISPLAAATDVYLYYTPGNGAASTGKARGFVVWARTAANG